LLLVYLGVYHIMYRFYSADETNRGAIMCHHGHSDELIDRRSYYHPQRTLQTRPLPARPPNKLRSRNYLPLFLVQLFITSTFNLELSHTQHGRNNEDAQDPGEGIGLSRISLVPGHCTYHFRKDGGILEWYDGSSDNMASCYQGVFQLLRR